MDQAAVGARMAQVTKQFGKHLAVDDLSLDVRAGEFLCLLGPSGCGKTTLLRLLAGLYAPDAGTLSLHGHTVADAATGAFVAPEHRNVGMVFQDYALWPHMRVAENVRFPLEARRVPSKDRPARVTAALERVGLGHLGSRYPAELSGGQQQRVALARAIVAEPGLMLFDEPLSNLDAALRESLGRDLAGLVRSMGLTSIYVTHDQAEALSLADRIVVLRDGRIVQDATPQALFERPADAWVASFIKAGSLVPGTVAQGRFQPGGVGGGAGNGTPLSNGAGTLQGAATLLVPPSAVELGEAADALTFTVTACWFRGDRYEIEARWGDAASPSVRFWHAQPVQPHARVPVRLNPDRLHVFAGVDDHALDPHPT